MKLARYALLMAALAAPVFASKQPKQYEVGTVHAHHFTTTTTSADCVGDGGSMVTCSTIDNTQDGTVYDITLADGTTRSLVHVHAPVQFGHSFRSDLGICKICIPIVMWTGVPMELGRLKMKNGTGCRSHFWCGW